MFGFYRLILSILVALSHFGFVVKGFNPGQWSVISFYVLSGFLMEKQVRKLCQNSVILPFYVDRCLRIFPLYLVSIIALLPFFSLNFGDYFQNVLLLPLNYVAFTEIAIMNRPAWSLACEFHFYLLVPFLTILSTNTLRAFSVLSFIFYCLSSRLPYPAFWSFHGLPALLFVFCAGMHLSRKDVNFIKYLWIASVSMLLFFMSTKLLGHELFSGIQINVMIGFSLSIPIINRLSKLSLHHIWDKRLGAISYPLFVCHLPVSYYCYKYLAIEKAIPILIVSIGISLILILLIERPLDKFRYSVRNRLTQKKSKFSS
jgi:peptidoglycan/LPS O-acetylase OafA/YrhL